MPRFRRYVSTSVPAIGCDMAKSRRAASGDPAGANDGFCLRLRLRLEVRQAKKGPGFVGNVLEVDEAADFRG